MVAVPDHETTQNDAPAARVAGGILLRGDAFTRLLADPGFAEGRQWQRQRLAADEALLREGQVTGKVYFVLSGRLRVAGTITLASGHRFAAGVADVGPGTLLGELALLDRLPHSANVTALEETEVAVIDGDGLMRFLATNRDIGYEIVLEMLFQTVPRLRKANERAYKFLAWGMKAHKLDETDGT